MDPSESEHLDQPSGEAIDEAAGPPWKPTRAGPGTIVVLITVSILLCILFMMFILRVF